MVRRPRLMAYLLLAGFFLLGSAGGYAVGTLSADKRLARSLVGGDHGSRREMFLGALSEQLDLSDEQRTQVGAVLERHHEERAALLREVFGSCGKPLRELHTRIDEEIVTLLEPGQQHAYRELVEKRRQRFEGTEK